MPCTNGDTGLDVASAQVKTPFESPAAARNNSVRVVYCRRCAVRNGV
jgi:hypothetical protein